MAEQIGTYDRVDPIRSCGAEAALVEALTVAGYVRRGESPL